jgi:iron complex transport system ATP-binding protein
LAQTLVREPEILLMDEPTSALDLSRQVEVLGLMRELARARGMVGVVLIALHDLNHALRFSDQAIVIADGRLVACGSSPNIITSDLLRDVYHVNAHRAVLAWHRPCYWGCVADGRRTIIMPTAETESAIGRRFEAAVAAA